jgi:hypothetical protein
MTHTLLILGSIIGKERKMDKLIQEFFSGIKVGARQSHKNMTLCCLLAATESEVYFMTLDEALDKEALIISEVSEGGTVPELKVTNRSNQKVLLLDGEELVGAKQNRVLNVTILIAPSSEIVIPVSCVEQGRWSYRSRKFGSESRAMNARLRKMKSQSVAMNLMHSGEFSSDQGVIWQEIEDKFVRMEAEPSETMAMADLYEAHRQSAEDYLKAFHPVDHQIGMAVFIEGELAGIDLLGKFETLRKSHSKLVNSYVMDALETATTSAIRDSGQSKARTSKILESAANASVDKRRSVALGNDIRLESDFVIGAGLEFDGQVLQMSIFLKDDGHVSRKRDSAMHRASLRRRSLQS